MKMELDSHYMLQTGKQLNKRDPTVTSHLDWSLVSLLKDLALCDGNACLGRWPAATNLKRFISSYFSNSP